MTPSVTPSLPFTRALAGFHKRVLNQLRTTLLALPRELLCIVLSIICFWKIPRVLSLLIQADGTPLTPQPRGCCSPAVARHAQLQRMMLVLIGETITVALFLYVAIASVWWCI